MKTAEQLITEKLAPYLSGSMLHQAADDILDSLLEFYFIEPKPYNDSKDLGQRILDFAHFKIEQDRAANDR